jgi:hypothetical protein
VKNRFSILFIIALLMTGFYAQNAAAYCVDPPGDVNGFDGSDVIDVQCSILTTLWALTGGGKPYPLCVMAAWKRADLNCDEVIDVTDSLLVIQTALNQSFNPIIDADQNGCPDACGDCGNDICNQDAGETCANCEFDCGLCEGSCCELHVGKGCNHSFVQSCVCAIDSFCCNTLWDAGCASLAAEECGLTCPENCGDGTCEAPEHCDNCAEDCGVCTGTCGDEICDALIDENCVNCAADCGVCEGTCCETSTDFGCNNEDVQTCVCNEDPFCCVLGWDPVCVDRAMNACSATCADICGDGSCTPGESCESCSEDCGLCSCDNGVCDYELGETCGNCQTDCGDCIGNCCLNNGSPGCNDLDIQTCVCEKYPTCCNVTWGNICALRASDLCGATCGNNQCGDGICNSVSEGEDANDFESCSSCPTDCGTCPSGCGNGVCAEDENCFDCPDDCSACTGVCYAENNSPGCCYSEIQECVCEKDPACCNTQWDAKCAIRALDGCNATEQECPQ